MNGLAVVEVRVKPVGPVVECCVDVVALNIVEEADFVVGEKAVVETSYVECCVNVVLLKGAKVVASSVTEGSMGSGKPQKSQDLERSRSLE